MKLFKLLFVRILSVTQLYITKKMKKIRRLSVHLKKKTQHGEEQNSHRTAENVSVEKSPKKTSLKKKLFSKDRQNKEVFSTSNANHISTEKETRHIASSLPEANNENVSNNKVSSAGDSIQSNGHSAKAVVCEPVQPPSPKITSNYVESHIKEDNPSPESQCANVFEEPLQSDLSPQCTTTNGPGSQTDSETIGAVGDQDIPLPTSSSDIREKLTELHLPQTDYQQSAGPTSPDILSPTLAALTHSVLPLGIERYTLTREFKKLALQGWYWGPLTKLEAEQKLNDTPDGSFLVRDSSDERYLLSLSFRSFGRTLHTRIEHLHGKFSFYENNNASDYTSVVALIEDSVKDSQDASVFCYSRSRDPFSSTYPVKLAFPVSRLSQVRSLQYLCRFVIRQFTRIDHIETLPLPKPVKGYLNQSYF